MRANTRMTAEEISVNTSFLTRVMQGNVKNLREFIENNPTVKINYAPNYTANMSALHIAAQNGNNEMVELLISFGADFNQVGGKSSDTALIIAAKHYHEEVVNYLLSIGADDSIKNKNDKSFKDFSHDNLQDMSIASKGRQI